MYTEDDIIASAHWLAEAKHVLVVAGAGMSAGCGVDYTSPEQFARLYPGMLQHGFNTAYECVGLIAEGEPERLLWGYLSHHIPHMRFESVPHSGYATLRELVESKDYFVLTSNVDGLFERSGFDPERVYTPQGDFRFLQCALPCSDTVVESKDHCWRLRQGDSFDPETFQIRPGVDLPRCQHCGGHMSPNVRGGPNFVHKPYAEMGERLLAWVKGIIQDEGDLFVIEIGAGFNTPTVTRFPAESIARAHPRSSFVRVNPLAAVVPRDLQRAVGFPLKGDDLIQRIAAVPQEGRAEASQRVLDGRDAARKEKEQQHHADMYERFKERYGHFDFEVFLSQLATNNDRKLSYFHN